MDVTDEEFSGDYEDAAGVRFLERDMDSRHREYAVRNDLTLGIGETSLEIGQATRLRTLHATYGMDAEDTATGEFGFENRIHAAYASALRTIGDVRVEAGLRVENDRVQVEQEDVVATEAWRAFPSLRLDWTPDENQLWELSVKYRTEDDFTGIGGTNTASYGTNKTGDDTRVDLHHQWNADSWMNDAHLTYEDASFGPRPACTSHHVGRGSDHTR